MRRAALYTRFSSDKQSDRSIEDQAALCERFALTEGLEIVERYEDRALSGASTIGRLGIEKLMRDARARRFDVVIAESLDRLSRDQEDLAGIFKRLRFANVDIITVHDGQAGEIHVGVKGLLGSLYLRDLAQKTHRGLAGVIRDGRHAGGRSFGYQPVPGARGQLVIEPTEAAVVEGIFAEYAAGRSPRELRHGLTARASQPPAGPHGTPQPSTALVLERTVSFATSFMSAGLFGIGKASPRTQTPGSVFPGQMLALSGRSWMHLTGRPC